MTKNELKVRCNTFTEDTYGRKFAKINYQFFIQETFIELLKAIEEHTDECCIENCTIILKPGTDIANLIKKYQKTTTFNLISNNISYADPLNNSKDILNYFKVWLDKILDENPPLPEEKSKGNWDNGLDLLKTLW